MLVNLVVVADGGERISPSGIVLRQVSLVPRVVTRQISFLADNCPFPAFYVDGTTIPEVDWDLGPSWAGLIPISGNANETRKLFFWFFPPGPQGSLDDLVFW